MIETTIADTDSEPYEVFWTEYRGLLQCLHCGATPGTLVCGEPIRCVPPMRCQRCNGPVLIDEYETRHRRAPTARMRECDDGDKPKMGRPNKAMLEERARRKAELEHGEQSKDVEP